MGKRGPCDHCGIQNTPLWRKGPLGKPVLCNACGSRWRIRGTLQNYTPRHALTHTSRSASPNPSFESLVKVKRRNISISVGDNGDSNSKNQENFVKSELHFSSLDDDNTSNGSTSDSEKPSLWGSQVPSKKRSGTKRYGLSTVERLHRDLYNILHDQNHPDLSVCTDGELIYHKNDHNVDIGLGCVLLEDSITEPTKSCYNQ